MTKKQRLILFHLFEKKAWELKPTLAWEVKEIIKNGQTKSNKQ